MPKGILYRHSLSIPISQLSLTKCVSSFIVPVFFLISSLLGLTDIIVKKRMRSLWFEVSITALWPNLQNTLIN